ncbi:unnamed protein product [Lasius platythorax]|uniref:Uncharacterized protein n=1 Tax=Lasius platythorax TaxID=488582 RepID=A0AAV2P4Y1_9HYME
MECCNKDTLPCIATIVPQVITSVVRYFTGWSLLSRLPATIPRATMPNRNSDDMKPREVLYEHNLEKSTYKYSFI